VNSHKTKWQSSRRKAGSLEGRSDGAPCRPVVRDSHQAGKPDPEATLEADSASRARIVTVDEYHAGQRVDNYLIKHLKSVPRAWVYKALRTGQVRINGGRARADRRLRAGDQLRIPPVRLVSRTSEAKLSVSLRQRLESATLYEDDHLIAIDKPSGLAVHGGSGQSLGLIEALRLARANAPYLELVHRLDKETSGCLLVAKSRRGLVGLHAQLRAGVLHKRYLALVRGRLTRRREITAALRSTRDASGERRMRTNETGKSSATWFEPVSVGTAATLLWALPKTGRTHQIRVHASACGHPLAGDQKYGHKQFNQRLKALGLRRLFLHAAELTLSHPISGHELTLGATLPEELQSVIDDLDLKPWRQSQKHTKLRRY